MEKKKKNISNKLKAFIWFGNDADGISMTDVLTVIMLIFFLVIKVLHLRLSIIYRSNSLLLEQFNIVISSIDSFMEIILIFYFGKKTIDTTITKVGLFKSGQYKSIEPLAAAIDESIQTAEAKPSVEDEPLPEITN